jgi:hypothetical protein
VLLQARWGGVHDDDAAATDRASELVRRADGLRTAITSSGQDRFRRLEILAADNATSGVWGRGPDRRLADGGDASRTLDRAEELLEQLLA